ncbi:MAG TPA: DNA repair protein RadC [Methanoregulaceae archaeon]|nr:DNA repair protein RadC [Methanoregulaceae archaeon]
MAARRITEIPERDRPRERLIRKGVEALSTRDLIAVILGRGTHGRDVLAVASEVRDVFERKRHAVTVEDLLAVPGIGKAKACELLAGFELSRRFEDRNQGLRITRPEDVLSLPSVDAIRHRQQEHFLGITLNGAGEVIRARTLTVGLLNASQVHPREAFADAITDRAAAIIFVHNHPSGSLDPSSQDLAITRQLVEAGDLLGIQVLDHLVVTRRGHRSLRESGTLRSG